MALGMLGVLTGVLSAGAVGAQAATQTFNYTGGEQTFTVPAGVTSVEVTAIGGHGGNAAASGGAAAQVTGMLNVTSGETLYVEVGGNGANGNPNGGGSSVTGGFNGGAPGGAGGGGASDVRTSARAQGLSPDDRLIVAGGGGGSGQNGSCQAGAGGAAEQPGESGTCGNGGGGAGTQSSGGAGGTNGCGFGQGGQLGIGGEGGGSGFGGEFCNLDTGGGGGGGLYGGGGGDGASADSSGGGGGGSSLVPLGGISTLAPNVEPQIQITYASSPAPTVVTEPASGVTSKAATLNATVNPEGSQVTACAFEYGTTTSYGAAAPCASLPGSGTSPVAVSAAITGLKASTTYHFRIMATNDGGTSKGSDQSFATAPPQEELPEIGRCLKLKKPTGKYQNATCTTTSAGENTGYYEWAFEPGSARAFTFKNGSVTLETVSGAVITCLENTYSGEYTGSKTAIVDLKLTGCEPTNRFGIKCQSQGAQLGEINVNTLEGKLGYIVNGVEPTVGLALTPIAADGGYLAQFHCGEVPISITGGVIAAYTPINKMVTTFTVSLKQTKGLQTPEALEGDPPELLNMIIGESAPERMGLKAADKVTNQENLELKASA